MISKRNDYPESQEGNDEKEEDYDAKEKRPGKKAGRDALNITIVKAHRSMNLLFGQFHTLCSFLENLTVT